jgi:ABC-type multidrug transport system fused ATPase/permease subunit
VGDLLGMVCQTLGSLALGFGVAFWSDWRMALVVTGTLPLLVVGAVIQTRLVM